MPVPADDLPASLVPSSDLPDFSAPSPVRRPAATPELPTTAPGVAASLTRGVAPYAAGAGAGALLGAPLLGVGAVPGAVGGAALVGGAQAVASLYNPIAERMGWPKSITPQEMTDRLLDFVKERRPANATERTIQSAAGAAADAMSGAGGARQLAEGVASPVAKRVLGTVAERPGQQAVSAALGGTAAQAAAEKGYGPKAQLAASLAAGGVAPVVSPRVRPQVTRLLENGVKLIPGQIAGGAMRNIEQKATSAPFLGHLIYGAEQQSLDSMNRATANQALARIGAKTPDGLVGNQIIAFGQSALDNAYGNVLPYITFKPGPAFTKDVTDIVSNASTLRGAEKDQLKAVINDRLLGRLDANGQMPGPLWKQVDGEIRGLVRDYGGSPDGAQRQLARHLDDLSYALRDEIARSNPDYTERLKDINAAYAAFVRVEDAAARRATSGGRFSSGDLLAAVKRDDNTARHRGFAAGKSLMQDWAQDVHDVMAKTVPDSGTAGRRLVADMLGGVAANNYPAYATDPRFLAAASALGAAYSPPGRAAVRAYANQPEPVRNVGRWILGQPSPYLIPGAANVVPPQESGR